MQHKSPIIAIGIALILTFFTLQLSAAPPTQGDNFCAEGQEPQFTLGFAYLFSILGEEIMGQPTECEYYEAGTGNAIQTTTTGRAVWIKSANLATFIRGDDHWAWTSNGLVTWTGESLTPPTTGDDSPPPNTDTPAPEGEVNVELISDGFWSPVALATPPDGSNRLFVVDQIGVIRIVSDNVVVDSPFLDVRDRMVALGSGYDERGLLGLAFHPDYDDNGKFYIYYSAPLRNGAPADWDHTARLSEFTITDFNNADPDSERILMEIDQPQGNHNGGTVGFGPDGYLYLSLGDGGAADDVAPGHVEDWYEANEGGNAQNINANLLGKIIRIDVNTSGGGKPYGIPADNPFITHAGAQPEIYAFGFRNPYRFSWDMGGSRQMFVGDAGQNLYEEVSLVEMGGNYGWNVREGRHCFSTANPDVVAASCPRAGSREEQLIDPIIEYSHEEGGLVVVGGYIYRGTAMPEMDGQYIFGNWSDDFGAPLGSLYIATRPASGHVWSWSELRIANMPNGELGEYIMSFGQDMGGEVYILTTDSAGPGAEQSGKLYKIVPAS
jgi:glucose/arabinose dehydrogenase